MTYRWDNRYRRLEAGELIRATDQVKTRNGWEKDEGQCEGKPAPDPAYTSHRTYRRRGHRVLLRIRHRFIPGLYYSPPNIFGGPRWIWSKSRATIFDPAMLKHDYEISGWAKWVAEVTG